jgi:predicted nucleic acid-binding protein
VRFLADTSIWGWASSGNRPDIQSKLADRFESGELVTCAPIGLEVLHRARTGLEYERLFGQLLKPLDWLPIDERIARRALAVQREMAQASHGNHLRPAIDYLVAAIAEAADGVRLWAFDRDLELICAHTGQPHEAEQSGLGAPPGARRPARAAKPSHLQGRLMKPRGADL